MPRNPPPNSGIGYLCLLPVEELQPGIRNSRSAAYTAPGIVVGQQFVIAYYQNLLKRIKRESWDLKHGLIYLLFLSNFHHVIPCVMKAGPMDNFRQINSPINGLSATLQKEEKNNEIKTDNGTESLSLSRSLNSPPLWLFQVSLALFQDESVCKCQPTRWPRY